MSSGKTPRFGSYIDNILASKASIKLIEFISVSDSDSRGKLKAHSLILKYY